MRNWLWVLVLFAVFAAVFSAVYGDFQAKPPDVALMSPAANVSPGQGDVIFLGASLDVGPPVCLAPQEVQCELTTPTTQDALAVCERLIAQPRDVRELLSKPTTPTCVSEARGTSEVFRVGTAPL